MAYNLRGGRRCVEFIASGQVSCEWELGYGGVYSNYCNLLCNLNYYDLVVGPGSCAALLASGSHSCANDFAPGMQYGFGGEITEGYCDFECGFCPSTYTAPQPGCQAFDAWDVVAGNSTCAAQLASGEYTCAEHFGIDDSLPGYCNLACQHNFLEHPQVYVTAGANPIDTQVRPCACP
jgi:hypothetical protein